MTKRFERKTAILAKIEAEYGTDSVPAGAANAMLVTNCSLVPLEAEMKSRNLYQSFLGNQGELMAGEHVSLTFQVEMASSGAAGTAPAFGPLLRACALAETITVDTEVEYEPVSAAFESVSIYVNLDGVNHKLLGARGSVKLTLTPKEIPYLEFSFKGIYAAPTDTALPAQTLTGFVAPLIVNKTNTSVFSLHGFSAIGESLELDLGNDVQPQFKIGYEGIDIVDRTMTGTTVIEADLLAAKNWIGIAKARTRGALAVQHGGEAGNIVEIGCPAIEIGAPTYGVTQKLRTYSLPLRPCPTAAGNDEIVLTFR